MKAIVVLVAVTACALVAVSQAKDLRYFAAKVAKVGDYPSIASISHMGEYVGVALILNERLLFAVDVE